MPYDIRFQTSFNCIVSGVSGSGKTTWVQKLLTLKSQLLTEDPARVILFYKVMQDMYLEMENSGLVHELINVNDHMPTVEEVNEIVIKYKDQGGSLLIFDDTMTDITKDFEHIFCNLSHHANASVIFLTQNLFYKNPIFRTMSLNAHYLVLMKNDRDKQQISILAKQFSPNNSRFITESYIDATKKPFSYLLLDFKNNSPQNLRVRANIFEFPCTVYIEKK